MPAQLPFGAARPLTALAFGLLAAGIAPAGAAEFTAASRIEAVTLFPDAAIVTRTLRIDLPAGEHAIAFRDLPAGLDPASFRAEGQATGGLALQNVDFRQGLRAGDSAREERRAALLVRRAGLQSRLEAHETQKAMIRRQAEIGLGDGVKQASDPESWPRAWELVQKALLAANDAVAALTRDIERLDAEIAALEPAPHAGPLARVAVLAVSAEAPVAAEIRVSYRVGKAGWRPVYDARLETRNAKPELRLVRRAMLRQATGEDWSDARLTLSTLPVARGTAAPELVTERLGFEPPPRPAPVPMAMNDRVRAAAQESEPTLAVRAPAAKIAATEPEARFETGGFQAEPVLPGRASLPGNGEEKSFRLSESVVTPELVVRAAPRLDPTAYLEARFAIAGDAPLLPGDVMLTRDGAYVGKNRLPLLPAGEPVRLGFGADPAVKVTRVPVSREARDPGLLSSTRSEEFRFRLTATNRHRFSVPIELVDRLPVSEEQAIAIERLPEMSKPDRENLDDRRGVFAYAATLEAGQAREWLVGWRVRWPADKRLVPQTLPR